MINMFNFFNKYRIHIIILFSIMLYNYIYFIENNSRIIIAFTLALSSLYLFNKYTDTNEDSINNPKETIIPNNKFLLFSIFLGFLGNIFIINTKIPILIFNIYLIIGYLYSFPIIKKKRIKNLFLIKNLYSAVFIWTQPIFLVYIYYKQTYFYSLLEVIIIVTIVEIIWDIRDRKGDLKNKIITLGNKFTIKTNKIILISILIIMSIIEYESFLLYLILILFILTINKDRKYEYYHFIIYLLIFINLLNIF